MTKTIETSRLVLRPFEEDDIDALYRIQSDPDAMRYTFCSSSRAETERRLRAYAALDGQLGYAPWTVVLRAEPRIIGWGGLMVDPFDPAHWGQGYATEFVRASAEPGVDYPRIAEQNRQRFKSCKSCAEEGKKAKAIWICIECSNERPRDVLLCEKCLIDEHEAHYSEEIVY